MRLLTDGSLLVSNYKLDYLPWGGCLKVVANGVTLRSDFHFEPPYGNAIVSGVKNPLSIAYCVSLIVDDTSPREQTFQVYGDGSVFAKNGFIQSSDISGKTDIKPLSTSLSKISALKPVSFGYKDHSSQMSESLSKFNLKSRNTSEEDSLLLENNVTEETIEQIKSEVNRKRIGLIAQDVEQIVPEVVRTLPNGKKGIMYSDLVALLIEGVKELKDSLDYKETLMQKMETRIQSLEDVIYPKKQSEKTQRRVMGTGTSTTQEEAVLFQNIPNPFNQETEIGYRVPDDVTAFIGIYNLNGQQLKEYSIMDKPSGKIMISASEFPAGIYIYSLIVDGRERDSKRMVLTD